MANLKFASWFHEAGWNRFDIANLCLTCAISGHQLCSESPDTLLRRLLKGWNCFEMPLAVGFDYDAGLEGISEFGLDFCVG